MDRTVNAGGDEQPAMEVPDRKPTVEQQLVERTRSALILRAVHALPEKQRAAVLLHKYQELDYDEIARILECSESALKSLLFRAYETLRVELAPLVNSVGVSSHAR
jgi:RNA polymerase sigma-70 factor (ECF subfamily)